jgi:hypothetical protein
MDEEEEDQNMGRRRERDIDDWVWEKALELRWCFPPEEVTVRRNR